MAFRRKSTRVKARRFRRRTSARRYKRRIASRRSVRVPRRSRTLLVRRSWSAAGVGTLTGSIVTFWYFSLSQMPSYATFSAMYRWYRIKSIRLTLRPTTNSVGPGNGNKPYSAAAYIAPWSNWVSPAGSTDIRATNKSRFVKSYGSRTSVNVLPAVYKTEVEINASAPWVRPVYKPWINTAYPTIRHYGAAMVTDATTNINDIQWYVDVQFVVEYKGMNM